MKCCPTVFVSHMNIKVVYIFKSFAKFQISIQCCSMKAVQALIIVKVNISFHISKICKYVTTATSCRIMKCCPSVVVSDMNIKVVFIFKDFAKIQMSIQGCNVKTVGTIVTFKVNTSFHISKTFK